MTIRWLLLLWFIFGLGLRLINLIGKPPWTDEFSTLVFSLGNSFLSVPLDQPIAVDVLLQPLQPQGNPGVQDVVTNLLKESNHPPLYFVLSHLWINLFPSPGGLVSLWGARSLAAIFGALSIPAIYALAWLTFRSRLVSHLATAIMAVSPYSIFLAQEARHYTLAILWVIASLACLIIAVRHIQNRTQLPISLTLSWIVINALGIATHYFFILTLCTEAIVLIFLSLCSHLPISPPWRRIYIVAISTCIAGAVWIPFFVNNTHGDKLTDWIQGSREGWAWISPIFQALAAWITMISLLPVESPELTVVIISGLIMLIFFIWVIPILLRGIKVRWKEPTTNLMTQVLTGIVVSAIALFFIFTYFLGIDLTRGARYNFVYFPAVIVLLGASLAICWQTPKTQTVRWGINGKTAVIIIWLMGFISAITVTCNLGYQKYYRPDLFVQLIENRSTAPILIATTHKTHVHVGEMMGVAREFKEANSGFNPLFVLAHQDQNPSTSTTSLKNTLQKLPKPLDLWLVNFYAPIPEIVNQCVADAQLLPAVNGYEYKLYHCLVPLGGTKN
ncbi:MAG: glycosyltransferase [Nostocaceae cyanobacterium]|nr:glycosyltransferase [Nostocaceae cyanobacterium]